MDEEATKKTPAQEMEEKLKHAYEAATEAERTAAIDLVKRSLGATRSAEVLRIDPGTAAILFWDHNKQNRKWDHALSGEYARQIEAGEWEFTNQGIGFLTSGDIGDGQHRLAGIVLAGKLVEVVVTFGMEPRAIVVLDTGKRRPPSDTLEINNISDAVRKTLIIKRCFGYLAKIGAEPLRTNRDVVGKVQKYETELHNAMEVGVASRAGIASPLFPDPEAQTIAFLFLVSGWPLQRIREKLALLQLGYDSESDDSPMFVTAKVLNRIKESKSERASVNARLGAAIKAFQLHEDGVKAIRTSHIKEAMKPKNLPDPSYRTAPVAATG